MSSNDNLDKKYAVHFESFTERHFIKNFIKKYRERRWSLTKEAIVTILRKPLHFINTEKLETITDADDILVCKLNFAVAGTHKSPKKSGNRCIVAVDKTLAISRVLLVYHKNDLKGEKETAWWQKMIKNNYSEYKEILS